MKKLKVKVIFVGLIIISSFVTQDLYSQLADSHSEGLGKSDRKTFTSYLEKQAISSRDNQEFTAEGQKNDDILGISKDKSLAPLGPEYVPGQLIVKLKEGKTIDDVRDLNAKYNVTSNEKVFKEIIPPQEVLKELKEKLAKLGTEHDSWYWQLDKNSKEYKDYMAKLEQEKETLKKKIEAEEELVNRLEARQKRAPEKAVAPGLDNVYLMKIEEKTDILLVVADYKNNPAVEYVEPDYIAKIQMVPNDPYYSSSNSWGQGYEDLWGLKKINAAGAWDISQGEGVIVAVIDTGVDYNHEDIAANIVKGYDFSNNDSDPMDDNGHGTHVAGTIVAIGNNSKGVIGVAPKAKVMAVKGLNANGSGFYSTLANCLKYAADNGADIISNSWGGAGSSSLIEDAVNYAYAKGCVIVVAAGNSGVDCRGYSPAEILNVITVASSDTNDIRSNFSNYGVKIDVAAPGGGQLNNNDYNNCFNILSLLSEVHSNSKDAYKVGASYLRLAGTSMACPHVSGLAALILSKKSTLNNEEVRQIIRQSADDDLAIPGWDVNLGYGRINTYKALDILNKNIIPPIAHISSLSFDRIANLLVIKGAASGNGFSSYKIEYGVGSSPTVWTILKTSTSLVSDNVLATLNLSNLFLGDYSIRLSVYSLSGSISQDRAYVYYSPNFLLQWAVSDFSVGIAVDEKNNFVYISDFMLDTIQKFDTEGKFLRKWSADTPFGITVDSDGYVWVLELTTKPKVINKYDADGNWVMGLVDKEQFSPYGIMTGIAIDKYSNIYMSYVDTYKEKVANIKKFDKSGNFIMNIGSYGAGEGQLLNPSGVIIVDDYLYVVDLGTSTVTQNPRVLKFKTDGIFISQWGSYGTADGQFNSPTYIAYDENGKIYVMDSLNSRVQIFDKNGNFLFKFGRHGAGEGEFYGNYAFYNGIYADKNIPHKYVYVVDGFNNRVQKFKAFNRPPVLTTIGNKTVQQGQLLKFEVKVSDADNDIMAYMVNNLPAGAKFVTVAGEAPAQAEIPGLYGDLNLDGQITNEDKVLLELGQLNEIGKITSDLNGNGIAEDAGDLVLIQQYLLGQRNFFPVIIRYGDLNSNGEVADAGDLTLMKSFSIGEKTPTEIQKISADLNGNGLASDADDLTLMKEYSIGEITSFPTTTKRFFIWKPASTQVGIYPSVSFKVTDGKEIVNELISITVIDDTPPTTPVVTDGGTYTTSSKTSLYASWTSSDAESGIAQYQYRITQDSTAGIVIRNWISTGTIKSVTASGLTLLKGRKYYFGVKAKNGAGIWSAVGYSDGILVQ